VVGEHLLARLLKVDLEARDGVTEDSGEQHPLEVVGVQTVDLRLKRVGQLRTAFVVRLLLGLLPEPVVLTGRELQPQAQ
jgi:hypothetical protein